MGFCKPRRFSFSIFIFVFFYSFFLGFFSVFDSCRLFTRQKPFCREAKSRERPGRVVCCLIGFLGLHIRQGFSTKQTEQYRDVPQRGSWKWKSGKALVDGLLLSYIWYAVVKKLNKTYIINAAPTLQHEILWCFAGYWLWLSWLTDPASWLTNNLTN